MLAFVLLTAVLCFGCSSAEFNCTNPPIFPNYDINSCCRVPQLNLGDAPQKCLAEIDAIKTNKDFPSFAHVCYPECIYRESGALQNGEIQMDKIRNFLQKGIKPVDHEIVPVIVQSFENCINNIHGHMNAIKTTMYSKLPDGCSPYSSMVWGCVNTDTFINCPAKMWKNEQECNIVRNFVRQCNPLPHVPLPMY